MLRVLIGGALRNNLDHFGNVELILRVDRQIILGSIMVQGALSREVHLSFLLVEKAFGA